MGSLLQDTADEAVQGKANPAIRFSYLSKFSGRVGRAYKDMPITVQMHVIVSFSNFAVTEPSVTASHKAAHS